MKEKSVTMNNDQSSGRDRGTKPTSWGVFDRVRRFQRQGNERRKKEEKSRGGRTEKKRKEFQKTTFTVGEMLGGVGKKQEGKGGP